MESSNFTRKIEALLQRVSELQRHADELPAQPNELLLEGLEELSTTLQELRVAVERELTERRQLEAQLVQSAKMASLGVMAGGSAHELRNPLGIISTNAQLLLEHPDDAQLHIECAQKIHVATQRASQIIENLLKFARPVSAQMQELDLHVVLEEALALLTYQMALQEIRLRKELQPDLPKVYGNPELLQQVFTNMILNACNAMPEGGVLTVRTRATEAGEVEILFKDTGRGIPPENLPKIFDPFFTTMPVGKGTGLGLSISYSIIRQHQGSIEVESRAGEGATFTIRLPALQVTESVRHPEWGGSAGHPNPRNQVFEPSRRTDPVLGPDE